MAAAQVQEDGRVTAIAAGVGDAATNLAERLNAIDGLAAALARACLERVFARPDAMAAMVTDALRRQMQMLHDDAMLAVRVSNVDFTETTSIEAMARESGARLAVTIDPDLPAGACRIEARLARIDIDVPGQWATLAAALDAMAQP